MELHRGRLIDHLHLKVRNLARSRKFYEAVLKIVGIPMVAEKDHLLADELWIDVGEPASHIHFAFQVPDRATVDKFHAAGLAAGGRDNGAPGMRKYHPGYYAAYLLDPDGNNIEAVHHGPFTRSAASVVIQA